MKKIVITYGLIASAISAVLWIIISYFMKQGKGFEYGMLIGYTAMLISFIFIYFGMKSYKENVGNGYLSFGKAVQIGLLITLIACVCYVITWAIVYNTMIPDFMDKYIAYDIDKMRASGASPAEIEKHTAACAKMKEDYKKPIFFFLHTFIEPLPVGILITLVSALILRTKNKIKNTITVN